MRNIDVRSTRMKVKEKCIVCPTEIMIDPRASCIRVTCGRNCSKLYQRRPSRLRGRYADKYKKAYGDVDNGK